MATDSDNLQVSVDQPKCIGCGACSIIAPKTFELDGQGKSKVKEKPWDDVETIKQAAQGCPVEAITVVE
ncbi:MAG: ferredoxin [Candidatus Daviesbacteria bacterium]